MEKYLAEFLWKLEAPFLYNTWHIVGNLRVAIIIVALGRNMFALVDSISVLPVN